MAAAALVSLVACDAPGGDPSSKTAASAEHEGPDFLDPVAKCQSTESPSEIKDDYWRGQFERVNAEDCQLIFFGDSITMDARNLLFHPRRECPLRPA